ncbi:uncharacterized protein PAC_15106 [Phialocephala subalpina]|uniref:Uncharacterized protein n=1 Tax=Phialocephala subalpina TaxID=576137 RepID=A0A1L7XJT6_9HELO|nr:uncharacterized protein PAC_15106 [Phialocephala subalpina]
MLYPTQDNHRPTQSTNSEMHYTTHPLDSMSSTSTQKRSLESVEIRLRLDARQQQQTQQRNNEQRHNLEEYGYYQAYPNPKIPCSKFNTAVGSIIKFNNGVSQRQDIKLVRCIHQNCKTPHPSDKDLQNFFKHPLAVLRIWVENHEPWALVSIISSKQFVWQAGSQIMPLYRRQDYRQNPESYRNKEETMHLEHSGGSFDHPSWFQYNHAYKVKLDMCIPFNTWIWSNRLDELSYRTLMRKLRLRPALWTPTDLIHDHAYSEIYDPREYDLEWNNLELQTNIELQDARPASRSVSPASSLSSTYSSRASSTSTPPSTPESRKSIETISNAQFTQLQQKLQNIGISANLSRDTTNSARQSYADVTKSPAKFGFEGSIKLGRSRAQSSDF